MALTPVHRQTLICSANKLNNRIYNYGYANVINYGVLSLIYGLLDSNLMIEYNKTRLLEHLAQKIETIDPDICTPRIDGGTAFPDGVVIIPTPTEVNTAPTVDNITIDVPELIFTSFTSGSFSNNFTDAQGDSPSTVRIESLPVIGVLEFNNVPIGIGFQFNISQVGALKYTRITTGANTTGFTFSISDNNDNPFFSNVATVFLNNLAIGNEPATIGDQAIIVENRAITVLTLVQFTSSLTPPYNDPENDLIDAIRIDEVSTANKGQFLYNNIPVSEGQIITREEIEVGLFTHMAANQDDISGDVFDFSARDEGSGIWVS